MEISSWRAFPIALGVAALFIFGIGAACAVTPEDDTGGGGFESDTFIPEGGSDTLIPEGGSDTLIPEGGSDTLIPEGGSDTLIPEGGSDTILIPENNNTIESLMQGTVDSIDADAGQMVLALTGSETVDVNLDQNTSVTVNGAPGSLQDLQPGDSVQVEVDQSNNVATSVIVLSEIMDTDILPQTQQGTVERVDADAGQMVLALTGNETVDVNLDQSTAITFNGAPGLLQDLQPGDSVAVEVDQDTALATLITVGVEPVTTTGEIDEIDLTSQTMTLVTPEGETLNLSLLQLDGSTEIIVEGGQGTLLDLASGASVEVTYDPDTREIDTIYVRPG